MYFYKYILCVLLKMYDKYRVSRLVELTVNRFLRSSRDENSNIEMLRKTL